MSVLKRLSLIYIATTILGIALIACGGDDQESTSAPSDAPIPADVAAAATSEVATPADTGAAVTSEAASPEEVAATTEGEAPVQPATLQIAATDAPPIGVTKILITASNIEVQKAGAEPWTVVVPGPVDFDLVEIQGIETTLGEAILEPGTYNQVRLVIEKAEVTVQGELLSAKVPSGRLKIVGGFTLDPGGTTIITLDSDAAKSVVIAGKNVLIKPVIKMLSRRGDQPLSEADEIGSIAEDAVTVPEETPDATDEPGSDLATDSEPESEDPMSTISVCRSRRTWHDSRGWRRVHPVPV